jgi:hypothetical protein
MSPISKHTPERVGTHGRMAHMQWLGTSLHSVQCSRCEPPRARKGLALRAIRAARKRETAWGMGNVGLVDGVPYPPPWRRRVSKKAVPDPGVSTPVPHGDGVGSEGAFRPRD